VEHFTNPSFWENRYQNQHTPWDIGAVSSPVKAYVDKLNDRDIRILIPGAGYAHEAIYLHSQGFKNVFVCDWAETAFSNLRSSCPDFPEHHQLIGDFFALELEVDLILEQTFFCAIAPDQRPDYAQKSAELLPAGGKLAGVLFAEQFGEQGPPFGGTAEEYALHFSPYYHIKTMEISRNSIKPRLGRELFIELVKM
jgi:hypothetical protein